MDPVTPRLPRQIVHSLYVLLGVVFVWRGVWVILDVIDRRYFGGDDELFAAVLIVVGIGLLYLHDHATINLITSRRSRETVAIRLRSLFALHNCGKLIA